MSRGPQPQHLTALQHANMIRAHRSAIKREIRSVPGSDGRGILAALLDDRDPTNEAAIARVPVIDFLCWPTRGQVRIARRMLTVLGTNDFKLVGALSDRQRTMLATLLRGNMATLAAAEDRADLDRWDTGMTAA